jgi:pimeloyl-ACP methyl ester carboxylesterase
MDHVIVNGLRIAYAEAGAGPSVLLLHGWPTSSHMWREVVPAIARRNRVVAIDLPGFGDSDKPLDVCYDFDFFTHVLDGFVDALRLGPVAVAGHDLGGPIAAHWAVRQPERITALALLNTLLYPQFHPSVLEFVSALSTPATRDKVTTAAGLAQFFRAGLADPSRATDSVLDALTAPFGTEQSRLALAKAGVELAPSGFVAIERGLPSLRVPVRLVYGVQDQILPDVADTMARVQRDVPHAEATEFADCGHFLQEERPHEVAALLADFFATSTEPARI